MLAGRNIERLRSVVTEIERNGGTAEFCNGDMTDDNYVKILIETTLTKFGGINRIVSNAGSLGSMGDVTALSIEGWTDTLNSNLTSSFYLAKYALPHLLESRGSMVFVSSFVGSTAGFAGMSAYAAAKAGLVGFAKNLAAEYGASGVRINAVLPGGTDTPMGAVVANSPDSRKYVESLHALQRLADPEEVARVIDFLTSSAASFVTGSAVIADGGISIYKP